MSLGPAIMYSTQVGPFPNSSQSVSGTQVVLVHPDQMSTYETRAMEEAKYLVLAQANTVVVTPAEINKLPTEMKLFVIPSVREDVIRRIRNHAEKPRILTARSVIEALKYKVINPPSRSLTVSLAMLDCRIFLVKSLNTDLIKRKIVEMCGICVSSFADPSLNVLITDKADYKYCAKARRRGIPVVSKDWIEETYSISTSDEENLINHDALKTATDYEIKPFLGLRFKINIPELSKPLRSLICDNSGKVAYGNVEITHIVDSKYPETDQESSNGPRRVDVEFLETCVRLGHYMTPVEYREHRSSKNVTVKQEILSQAPDMQAPAPLAVINNPNGCFTPPNPSARSTLSSIKSNGFENRYSQNQSMPPPATTGSRQMLQKKPHIEDIILESLGALEGPQHTQLPSTQIRRLPENEIQIERTCEPSQQLYWNDNCRRRH